jgi:hypothetical protein
MNVRRFITMTRSARSSIALLGVQNRAEHSTSADASALASRPKKTCGRRLRKSLDH